MSTEQPAPALPRNFLRPCVLLLLREDPSHGYDLLERLRSFGFAESDPGGLYRILRRLEEDGLVRSAWERSSVGPDRRIYELTRAGMEELHRHAKTLSDTAERLQYFLGRYEEFVTLGRPRKPAPGPSEPRRAPARSEPRRGPAPSAPKRAPAPS